MLTGAPDHPKTLALQAELECGRAQTIGHLELLWHFTAEYAPTGALGRWPNRAIARACAWEGDPDAFVRALIAARYVDESAEYRLVVHDWHEHARQHVKRKVARKGGKIVTCAASRRPAREKPKASPRPIMDTSTHPTPPHPTTTPPNNVLPATLRVAGVEVALEGSWSKQAVDLWIARFKGTAPAGKIGKQLKPVVEKYGWGTIAPAWAAYLEDAEARYASAERFAETLAVWLPSVRPTGPVGVPDPIPEPDLAGPSLWNEISAEMQRTVPAHSWATWFRPVRGVRLEEDKGSKTLIVTAPGPEWRRQLREVYIARLKLAAGRAMLPGLQFRVLVEVPP